MWTPREMIISNEYGTTNNDEEYNPKPMATTSLHAESPQLAKPQQMRLPCIG